MIANIFVTLGLAAGAAFLFVKTQTKKEKLPLMSVASGLTLKAKMKSINDLYGSVLASEANRINIPVSSAAAILAVESSGRGFGNDGQLLIRFEPKVFKDRSGQDISYSHKNNAAEHQTFNNALALDNGKYKVDAYKSISMGIGQIMGFNATRIGYTNAEQMYAVFAQALEPQIVGVFKFIETDKTLLNAARTDDFAAFAKKYNGSGYAANKYDVKLADAKAAFVASTGLV